LKKNSGDLDIKTMKDDLINGAVSINPSVVTPALNPTGSLEQKVHQVWVDNKQDRVFVFRESSSAHGQFSKDIYKFSTLDYLGKENKKYNSLPIFPDGAFAHLLVSGIQCSAMVRLDEKFLLDLSTRLNLK
jgi:DNA helicase HerA-like ATPase